MEKYFVREESKAMADSAMGVKSNGALPCRTAAEKGLELMEWQSSMGHAHYDRILQKMKMDLIQKDAKILELENRIESWEKR